MMIERRKKHQELYPNWQKRKRRKSTPQLCRERDNNRCIDCGAEHRTTYTNAEGEPSMYFLHASHLHRLDPEYWTTAPINGQKVRTRCPRCHRRYDLYWKRRAEEAEHQRRLHQILIGRFIEQRFMQVI